MYYVCIHKCILGNDRQTYDLILLISWYLEQVCVLASNLFTCKKVITPSIGPNIIGPYSIKESEHIPSNVVTMNQNPCLLPSPPKVTLLPAKSFAQPRQKRQKRLREFIKDRVELVNSKFVKSRLLLIAYNATKRSRALPVTTLYPR